MRCRKAQHLVSVDFDGRLNVAQYGALHEHLTHCPACRRFVDRLRAVSSALSVMQLPEPRLGFPQRFMARLPDQPVARLSLREWVAALRPARLAAGGLGVAAGVIMAAAMNGEQRLPALQTEDPAQRVYAESFDPLPDGSAAAQYVALVKERSR